MKKLLLSVSLMSLLACSTRPAANAGFLEEPKRLNKIAELPFQRAWIDPAIDFTHYKTIKVEAVNTHYVLKSDWVLDVDADSSKREMIESDIADLAEYTRVQLVEQFRERDEMELTAEDEVTDKRTLILQLAIVEAVPSSTVRGALEIIPHPGIKVLGKLTNDSSIAFEAKFVDAESRAVVAAFADRETRDIRLIDTRQFSMFGTVKSVVDEWAQQLARTSSRMEGEVIGDSFPLKVW